MSGSDGRLISAASCILLITAILLVIMTGMQAGKAYARASLATYVTMPTGSWEPGGYDVNGSATKLTVDTLGWNATRIMGNVGIGDGSFSALKRMSNPDGNYWGTNYMAADVSEAPWDPGRIDNLNYHEPERTENNATKSINDSVNGTDDAPSVSEEKNPENVSDAGTGTISGQMALNDPYHSILFGRPINDLLYSNPLAVPGTAYLRLVGLGMPGGGCLNIGMQTLATGY